MAPIHHWSPYLGGDDDDDHDEHGRDDDEDGHGGGEDGDLLTGYQGIQGIPDQHVN